MADIDTNIIKPTFNENFYKLIQNKNLLTNTFDNNNIKLVDNFYKIGYLLELVKNGSDTEEWIYVEMDKFNNHILDHIIPTIEVPRSKILDQPVHNIYVISNKKSLDINKNIKKGKIKFTPFTYNIATGNDKFDINNNLEPLQYNSFYGCMQIYLGTSLLFAYNGFTNSEINDFDIGIGNDPNLVKSNGNKSNDWTFAFNSNEYSYINLKVYAITNNNIINLKKDKINLKENNFIFDKVGICHGDEIIYNSKNNTFTQTKIPYNIGNNMNQPNFIIALTGQSNSQGFDAYYNELNFFDQPNDKIFAFNRKTENWEKASLTDNSIGAPEDKSSNSQSLAFHFAKRLIEAYPHIRPGIINFGIAGQSIARWINILDSSHPLYNDYYIKLVNIAINYSGGMPSDYEDKTIGSIYRIHKYLIDTALGKLDVEYRKINVILWHQGETDSLTMTEFPYYEVLQEVIKQYRSLEYCNDKTPFIAGTPTADLPTYKWNAVSSELLKLNNNGDPYTKCVDTTDNYSCYDEYGNYDKISSSKIHYGPEAHRKMGTLYFKGYRDMYNDSF